MDFKIISFILYLLIKNTQQMDTEALITTITGLVPLIDKLDPINIDKHITITIPTQLKRLGEGILKINHVKIYGLQTLFVQIKDIKLLSPKEDPTKVHEITFDIRFGELGTVVDYDIDMALLGDYLEYPLPLYGRGNFSYQIDDLKIIANLKFSEKHLRNMKISDLNLTIKFQESNNNTVTGLWNNEELSNIISGLLNALAPLVRIIYDFEQECFDCIISKSLQFTINYLLKVENNVPNSDCECLPENWSRTLDKNLIGILSNLL